jgi:hypothetical protein
VPLAEQCLEFRGAGEQHVTFISEVPKERARRHPDTCSDLTDGGVFEALLAEEVKRGCLKSLAAAWFPAGHAGSLLARTPDVTARHHVWYLDVTL